MRRIDGGVMVEVSDVVVEVSDVVVVAERCGRQLVRVGQWFGDRVS
jgi:hypothetical protein